MNSRKRGKPYISPHVPHSLPKRRRPLPLDAAPGDDAIDATSASSTVSKAPTSVMIIGVPAECSVLELKSRFEMYGPISRTRMESNGFAYINFRSNEAAQYAVGAARDSTFPVTLHSVPVQVMWVSDPISQWKGGINTKDPSLSRLVRAHVPLRRLGRGSRLGSPIMNPHAERFDNDNYNKRRTIGGSPASDRPFEGRKIVAYDDILQL